MRLVLNLILILIMALCLWGGFKKGLINGLIGIIAIIIALVGANALASRYSGELVPAIEPFIGGYIDSETTSDEVLAKLGYGDSDKSLTDIMEADSSLRIDYAYECCRLVGFYKDISEDLAEDSVTYANDKEVSITNAVITIICNTIAYVGCVTVAFIMILILVTSFFDVLNIDIRLPNLDVLDEISGMALGLAKGFLYCVLLCWLLGFLGIIIGKDTADKDALFRFFLAFRFITRTLI